MAVKQSVVALNWLAGELEFASESLGLAMGVGDTESVTFYTEQVSHYKERLAQHLLGEGPVY